ncbi:hypothetical protein ACIQF6_00015 [Kitasatospora sp. NPDC092948]|uniref:hypothetical protein n=1 Tax=Kitasatospora sp. NPDC092948 TaxID=3364088 RepID=UPI00382B848A
MSKRSSVSVSPKRAIWHAWAVAAYSRTARRSRLEWSECRSIAASRFAHEIEVAPGQVRRVEVGQHAEEAAVDLFPRGVGEVGPSPQVRAHLPDGHPALLDVEEGLGFRPVVVDVLFGAGGAGDGVHDLGRCVAVALPGGEVRPDERQLQWGLRDSGAVAEEGKQNRVVQEAAGSMPARQRAGEVFHLLRIGGVRAGPSQKHSVGSGQQALAPPALELGVVGEVRPGTRSEKSLMAFSRSVPLWTYARHAWRQ